MRLGRLSKRLEDGLIERLARDRRGVTALEYALMTALVALAIAGALTLFSGNANQMFSTISNTL